MERVGVVPALPWLPDVQGPVLPRKVGCLGVGLGSRVRTVV